jgi:protein tyrosine phosphatase (PTP) superfamily phosphohydrolase (DUF442 family)
MAANDTALAPSLREIHRARVVDARLATSGQPNEGQLCAIADAGYRTVINLALHDDPRYSLADEAGTVAGLGLAYVHIPVAFAAPTEADLLAFFEAMRTHADERVWIHCAANLRVSAFVGLWRVLELGEDRATAFAQLESLWQPDAVWAGFIETMLAKLGRRASAE